MIEFQYDGFVAIWTGLVRQLRLSTSLTAVKYAQSF